MTFLKSEKGAAIVEYSIIIGVVALFSFAAWKMLGIVLKGVVIKLLDVLLW